MYEGSVLAEKVTWPQRHRPPRIMEAWAMDVSVLGGLGPEGGVLCEARIPGKVCLVGLLNLGSMNAEPPRWGLELFWKSFAFADLIGSASMETLEGIVVHVCT